MRQSTSLLSERKRLKPFPYNSKQFQNQVRLPEHAAVHVFRPRPLIIGYFKEPFGPAACARE